MKKIFIIIPVILIFIVIGVLTYKFYFAVTPPRPLEKVVFLENWVNNAQFAGIYVAKEKGYYKEQGLDVEIQPFQNNLDIGSALAADKATFGIFTPVELLSEIANGTKIKAVAAVYQTSPLVFVSLKTENIQSPKDFRGKVLGVKGGELQAKIMYQTIANNYNVPASSYTLKDLDFSMDEADDLLKKRADIVEIYRTDQTYFFNQRNISYNTIYPENFGYQSYGDTIATSQNEIKKNPDQVRRFIRATQQGWSYALAHQQEALTMTKKYEDKLYNDPLHEAYILSQSASLIQPTGGQPIGAMSVIEWNNAINAMETEGVIKGNIDPNDAYTSEFLSDR